MDHLTSFVSDGKHQRNKNWSPTRKSQVEVENATEICYRTSFTVVLKIIQPPLLFPMTSIETSRATWIVVLTVCFRSIKV